MPTEFTSRLRPTLQPCTAWNSALSRDAYPAAIARFALEGETFSACVNFGTAFDNFRGKSRFDRRADIVSRSGKVGRAITSGPLQAI
jgi:hypothetical protein